MTPGYSDVATTMKAQVQERAPERHCHFPWSELFFTFILSADNTFYQS